MTDENAENVTGGLSCDNWFGDFKTYKIGMDEDHYAYTFPASLHDEISRFLTNLPVSGSRAERDRQRLTALVENYGSVLTRIDGLDPEWY